MYKFVHPIYRLILTIKFTMLHNSITWSKQYKIFKHDPRSKHNWQKSKHSKQHVSIDGTNEVGGSGKALSPSSRGEGECLRGPEPSNKNF